MVLFYGFHVLAPALTFFVIQQCNIFFPYFSVSPLVPKAHSIFFLIDNVFLYSVGGDVPLCKFFAWASPLVTILPFSPSRVCLEGASPDRSSSDWVTRMKPTMER